MNRLYTFLFVLLTSVVQHSAHAQTTNGNELPAFRIALTDSSYFNRSELKKAVPVMLIYFDPACEHCQEFTRQLINSGTTFRNMQIVMISNQPLPAIKKFESDYHLKDRKNFKVGTEGATYKMLRHYQIQKFPFVAIYDENWQLVKLFREEQPLLELIKTVANL